MTAGKTQETVLIKSADNASNGDISIKYLLRALWFSRWLVLTSFILILTTSVAIVLKIPNTYKATVLLMPNGDNSSLSIPGQLGSLAALAGVNVGTGGNEKTVLALEIVKSKQFLIEFIQQENIKPEIIAAEGWDHISGDLKYAADQYDTNTQEWVRDVSWPKTTIPSDLEAATAFLDLFTVSEDKTNGMVKFSIQYYSPKLTKAWLDTIVIKINERMRSLDAEESITAIGFLNEELEQTSNTEIRAMLFSLIEEQTKTLMLSKVKKDYAFSIVDPAIVPELKFKPQRAIILAMVCIVLFILLVALSALRYRLKEGTDQ